MKSFMKRMEEVISVEVKAFDLLIIRTVLCQIQIQWEFFARKLTQGHLEKKII